jgi:hypothetical protein
MSKNLDSPHPLTPNPKNGILLTRIMSPLSQYCSVKARDAMNRRLYNNRLSS